MKRQAERLVAEEIAFVYRPEKGKTPEAEIADLDVFLAEMIPADRSSRRSIASYPGQSMFRVPEHLLTPEQERQLFLQMNYLKCRANALRSRLNPARPSRSKVDAITSLLADAKRIRDCLCECNLRLILAISRKLSQSQLQFEELVSEGMPILLRCIDLFDVSRGFRFSTYVTHSVQRHLYRVLRKSQRRREQQATTDAEILQNVAGTEFTPDSPVDFVAVLRSIWSKGRAELDEREQIIVKRRFGLDGDREQSLRQISGELGISKERVRQLQIRALHKLHAAARSLNLSSNLF